LLSPLTVVVCAVVVLVLVLVDQPTILGEWQPSWVWERYQVLSWYIERYRYVLLLVVLVVVGRGGGGTRHWLWW
jgi:hypothetical protein